MKLPRPEPLVAQFAPSTGLAEVDQQMPRAVTAAPPSAVTSPATFADEAVTLDTAPVVTPGTATGTAVDGALSEKSSKAICIPSCGW